LEAPLTFTDRFSLYHDRPTQNGIGSSGNPAIYTAYAKKLGLPIDYFKVAEAFSLIQVERNGIRCLIRHPDRPNTSPISREEIMGWAYLRFLTPSHLNGWNFSPYPIPKFCLKTLIKQVLEAKGQHRNYFWKNNLGQLYRFTFSVPLTDRAFIIEHSNMKINFVSKTFYKLVAKVDSMLNKENGIRWLKYGKSLSGMQKEFMEGHPFRSF
jgi:hypothetical protein